MSSIIGTLLDIGLKIFGLRGELSKARQVRKQQVADFLTSIAKTIEDASASLKLGNCPHGACQILHSHSQHMASAIGDLIGAEQAEDLGNQLHEVWQIERLHSELLSKPPEENQRDLHVLDQAAGLFRATADIVRVSP